ncbi:RES family NAD+ phosphorylase [Roseateles sp. L2-2]|uniref:RES family NAD+ phosphorylase n=1 Tax=Roseateles sp. L2-2 TaxID=3422597 RepID=UPI003D3662A9
MKMSDFPSMGTFLLPSGQVLYRVQSPSMDVSKVARGPVVLHAGPEKFGRFDLSDRPTAYFATRPQTALHEAVYRKNTHELKNTALEGRELIAVATAAPQSLADLRPYSAHFPVLQSVRLKETQELTNELCQERFDGLISRSAQQDGHDCVILFDPPADLFRLLWRSPLSHAGGQGHQWVQVADRGARIPFKG